MALVSVTQMIAAMLSQTASNSLLKLSCGNMSYLQTQSDDSSKVAHNVGLWILTIDPSAGSAQLRGHMGGAIYRFYPPVAPFDVRISREEISFCLWAKGSCDADIVVNQGPPIQETHQVSRIRVNRMSGEITASAVNKIRGSRGGTNIYEEWSGTCKPYVAPEAPEPKF